MNLVGSNPWWPTQRALAPRGWRGTAAASKGDRLTFNRLSRERGFLRTFIHLPAKGFSSNLHPPTPSVNPHQPTPTGGIKRRINVMSAVLKILLEKRPNTIFVSRFFLPLIGLVFYISEVFWVFAVIFTVVILAIVIIYVAFCFAISRFSASCPLLLLECGKPDLYDLAYVGT